MRKLEITYKPLANGKGVELATPCPNGRPCMVGSKECGRCNGFSKRGMPYLFIKCKIDNPLKLV